MKVKITVILVLLTFIVICTAFDNGFKGINYGVVADSVRFAVPANFPKPVYDFKDNPVTGNGFKLGRILFYDPLLSKDKSISCANCHQSFAAFANLDHAVSHGVDECLGTRNAPPLFNLAWQKEFMWDGGVHHIEVSPMNAMTNPCEMATDLNTIVSRLQETKAYSALFKAAFGTAEINSQRVFRAMAQFTSMLVSANSKYDKYIRHEAGGTFTSDETAGYALFKTHCSTCHQEPLFTDLTYRSNGLDLRSEDIGRDSITHLETDRGKFRVPSLRNVELTSPYMHDGRFDDLKQVLEHYNSGVKNTANLDPDLHKAGILGIRLNMKEQSQLIAFLKTLTDTAFANDKRFQTPQ
ncbi:cytochrome c peroxidase [Mucilaginibacter sabulilitoris]|uniref:Cytochrome c peroxidase n=1 Tax=Mucilaginibacter sabulilitoris TaxID=1173583 RepID=A0ABZ0TFL7_9SPHI|nr:cytochrome c peroxidase [Mucilaginibacter sabulilitoris]WPU91752.1 cytochrome c peroxidase [Mucilaginibacter sabulilitoris]